jgi:hypothetical protein
MLFDNTLSQLDKVENFYLSGAKLLAVPPRVWFVREKERMVLLSKADRNVRRRL